MPREADGVHQITLDGAQRGLVVGGYIQTEADLPAEMTGAGLEGPVAERAEDPQGADLVAWCLQSGVDLLRED